MDLHWSCSGFSAHSFMLRTLHIAFMLLCSLRVRSTARLILRQSRGRVLYPRAPRIRPQAHLTRKHKNRRTMRLCAMPRARRGEAVFTLPPSHKVSSGRKCPFTRELPSDSKVHEGTETNTAQRSAAVEAVSLHKERTAMPRRCAVRMNLWFGKTKSPRRQPGAD